MIEYSNVYSLIIYTRRYNSTYSELEGEIMATQSFLEGFKTPLT